MPVLKIGQAQTKNSHDIYDEERGMWEKPKSDKEPGKAVNKKELSKCAHIEL